MRFRKTLTSMGETDRQEYLSTLAAEIRRAYQANPKHYASAIVVTQSALDVTDHGFVEIFDTDCNGVATRVYAWIRTAPDTGDPMVVTIPGVPPIDSPSDAINAFVERNAALLRGKVAQT